MALSLSAQHAGTAQARRHQRPAGDSEADDTLSCLNAHSGTASLRIATPIPVAQRGGQADKIAGRTALKLDDDVEV